MKTTQIVDTVRERERERELHSRKKNVELVSFLTHTTNFIKNKQAKNISFVNNTKKADYVQKKLHK